MAKTTENQQKLEAVLAVIAELEARQATLQAQFDEVKAELKVQVGIRWELDRAVKMERPLTPAIKVVLKAMADGAVLIRSSFGYPDRFYLDRSGESRQTVRSTVFEGLQERQLIQAVKPLTYRTDRFELSERGRTALDVA